jgi:hypothetical protein
MGSGGAFQRRPPIHMALSLRDVPELSGLNPPSSAPTSS